MTWQTMEKQTRAYTVVRLVALYMLACPNSMLSSSYIQICTTVYERTYLTHSKKKRKKRTERYR